MIIKSMSRKDQSFDTLYDYIKKGMEGLYDYPNAFVHNFYSAFDDRKHILKGFNDNVTKLKKRKNGNNLYHEVISVKVNPNIKRDKHYTALYDITRDYISMRADKCLVIGGIHDEHDHHIHMHLMISSNELGSNKRLRLSKKDFSVVKQLTEEKALALHPELAQKALISAKDKKSSSINKNEDALKRRTKKPSIKDQFKDRLKTIFDRSVDKADFFNNLEKADIEIYTRGKTVGFKDVKHNRKHRLKTLGLEAEFEAINNKLAEPPNNVDKSSSIDDGKKEDSKDQHIKRSKAQPSAKKTKDHNTYGNSGSRAKADKRKPKTTETNKQSPSNNQSQSKAKTKDKQNKNADSDHKVFSFKQAVSSLASEWIMGDFSKRDKRIQAEKTKKYRKSRRKMIADEDRTLADKVREIGNRWVMGNFEEEKARLDMNKWKKKHKKQQKDINKTKSRKEQSLFANVVETGKEYLFGDFTNRDLRAAADKQKVNKKKWSADQKKQQAKINKTKNPDKQSTKEKVVEAGKEWLKGDFEARANRQRAEEKEKNRMRNKNKRDKEQAKIDQVKSREEQSPLENIVETTKEWVLGDFTNRDRRAKKAKQEKQKSDADHRPQEQKDYDAKMQKRRDEINKVRQRIKTSRDKNNDKGRDR